MRSNASVEIVVSVPAAVSFDASDVPPDQLRALLADYLAFQQFQIFRRLVVVRLLVLAVVASGAARLSGLLSPAATALLAAIFTIPAAAVWIAEVAAKRRFGRRLAHVPHVAVPGDAIDEPSAGKS